MNPVLYRYRDSESVIKAMEGYTPGEGWVPLYDQAAVDAAVDAAVALRLLDPPDPQAATSALQAESRAGGRTGQR